MAYRAQTLVALIATVGCAEMAVGPEAGETVSLRLLRPAAVAGAAGQATDSAVMVRFEGHDGRALTKQTLNVTSVAGSSGAVIANTAVTGGDGVARIHWQLGTVAGAQSIQAAAAGASLLIVAAVRAGPAKRIAVSGDTVFLTVGGIVVDVGTALDEFGNPRSDVVRWASDLPTIVSASVDTLRGNIVGIALVTASAGAATTVLPARVQPWRATTFPTPAPLTEVHGGDDWLGGRIGDVLWRYRPSTGWQLDPGVSGAYWLSASGVAWTWTSGAQPLQRSVMSGSWEAIAPPPGLTSGAPALSGYGESPVLLKDIPIGTDTVFIRTGSAWTASPVTQESNLVSRMVAAPDGVINILNGIARISQYSGTSWDAVSRTTTYATPHMLAAGLGRAAAASYTNSAQGTCNPGEVFLVEGNSLVSMGIIGTPKNSFECFTPTLRWLAVDGRGAAIIGNGKGFLRRTSTITEVFKLADRRVIHRVATDYRGRILISISEPRGTSVLRLEPVP